MITQFCIHMKRSFIYSNEIVETFFITVDAKCLLKVAVKPNILKYWKLEIAFCIITISIINTREWVLSINGKNIINSTL
jgi:hypothetical protein